ncbi:XdhC family protein [Altererythrobacter aquiaggeris]|uniref:XdhC family protein n=1 Tax=Aestuarierythrobacter aquiaggeris TaxID=1898396 RepID=UPI00301A5607
MTTIESLSRVCQDEDHAALYAACETGVGLCTIVGIDGSFSRRIGAQLAILPDGTTAGSLSDGCLEAQLAADLRGAEVPKIIRYGQGSAKIDFRLPCGGGLDILLDPRPDRDDCRQAVRSLEDRCPATIALPKPTPLAVRKYIPQLRIIAVGEGPELEAFGKLGEAAGAAIAVHPADNLPLSAPMQIGPLDRWTAVLLLFHDHERELALLADALSGGAFYIGAQGGENARTSRVLALAANGISEEDIARVRSPVGLIAGCKSPSTLALSALAEIVGEYEHMRAAD